MDNTQRSLTTSKKRFNRREKMRIMISLSVVLLLLITLSGIFMPVDAYSHNYSDRRLVPSLTHLFGTDQLGRDMFARTIKGLSISLSIGIPASLFSALTALVFGMASAVIGGKFDQFILAVVDVFMGVPHLVLLILISLAAGKGLQGVVIGLTLTHWPSLTRIVRAETLEVRSMQYVKAAAKFGVSRFTVAKRHMLPHVLPQFLVGLVLLLPHAILHEASVTFLGFGLSADKPAIGNILSDSMNYLAAGMWWLVVFPGAALLGTVLMFESLSDNLKALLDPKQVQE